ncbi:MAG: inositol monophosphatase family protein, partial [Eubacteriales bacterium]|nr:inositol monophosphatase family protein [Eubacteriales bacterium]
MIQALQQIARDAGELILNAPNAAIHKKEGHYNFVTDTDVAVQRQIKEALRKLRPEARFFAEEQTNEALTDAPTFVVDPIDGTINFMRSRAVSAVSIGYLENKKPVAGVVFNPYEDEMFWAQAGKGAFLNGQPIHVSALEMANALIAFGTAPYDAELATVSMRAAAAFLQQAGDLRRTGSAAVDLCDVACGRAEVFYELRLRPWDVAAGSLIVTEAGGEFFSLGHDAPYYDDAAGVLA